MPQKAEKVSQTVAQGQGQGAEEEEIEGGAQENGSQEEEADLPAPHGDGKQKEGGGDQEPEEQIQESAQKAAADAHPEDPHQIVEQAHRRAQPQSKQESRGLGGDRDLHAPQWKSRERKPPRWAGVSS